jgi:signal transduction histidine kinase
MSNSPIWHVAGLRADPYIGRSQTQYGKISRKARRLLRDKLNVILGFAALLREDTALTEHQRRFARNILLAGEAILQEIVLPSTTRNERCRGNCTSA